MKNTKADSKNTKIAIDFYVNPDKEEAWLNRCAEEGWVLSKIRFGGLYTVFERCRPKEYELRIELLKYTKSSKRGQNYLDFLAEAGIECVYSLFGYAYYRKRSDGKPFELYTDVDSKLRHIKGKQTVCFCMAWLFLILGVLTSVAELVLWFVAHIVDPFGISTAVIMLCASVFFFLAAQPYRRQIQKLIEEEIPDTDVLIVSKKQRDTAIYPFVWAILIFSGIGLVVGVLVGFFI